MAMIQYLIGAGANINAIDSDNMLPSDTALKAKMPEYQKIETFILERIQYPPMPVPDSAFAACQRCKKGFTMLVRRHHCRHCGKLCCKECSLQSIALPSFGYAQPERVCGMCYDIIKRTLKHEQTSPRPAPQDDDVVSTAKEGVATVIDFVKDYGETLLQVGEQISK